MIIATARARIKNDNAFFNCITNEKVDFYDKNIFVSFSFFYLAFIHVSSIQSNHTTDIKTSALYVGGKPTLITLDYVIKMNNENNEFRLSYYRHKLNVFTQIVRDCFGPRTVHSICGNFKQLNENSNPAFYIRVVEKFQIPDDDVEGFGPYLQNLIKSQTFDVLLVI